MWLKLNGLLCVCVRTRVSECGGRKPAGGASTGRVHREVGSFEGLFMRPQRGWRNSPFHDAAHLSAIWKARVPGIHCKSFLDDAVDTRPVSDALGFFSSSVCWPSPFFSDDAIN